MTTEIEITTEIDDGDDVEGCYVVATVKAKGPYRLWRLIQHLKDWEPGEGVEVHGQIVDGDFVGRVHYGDKTWPKEGDFCESIYHPRLGWGDVFMEFDSKREAGVRARRSFMLLKRADENRVWYVEAQGGMLGVRFMTDQEWLDKIRPLQRVESLRFAKDKPPVWVGLAERTPVATRERATAEKGYAHPGSVIELPDQGGVIHLQYGHPKEVGRNGCFTVDVIQGLVDNLGVYQDGDHPMRCEETHETLQHLGKALKSIRDRRRDRETRAVHQTDSP